MKLTPQNKIVSAEESLAQGALAAAASYPRSPGHVTIVMLTVHQKSLAQSDGPHLDACQA